MKLVELKLICAVVEGGEQDHINTLTIGGINPVNVLSVDADRKIILDVIDYEIKKKYQMRLAEQQVFFICCYILFICWI